MKRVFLLTALIGISSFGNAQEKPLKPVDVKKENAATAVEEKQVAAEKSEAIQAIEQGKEINVKTDTSKANAAVKGEEAKATKVKKDEKSNAPLNSAQVENENAATAAAEREVTGDQYKIESTYADLKMNTERDTTVYTATSKVTNSGFQRTIGFDGAWKFDLNLENRQITLTGGTLNNKGEAASNALRLMVYLADKPFDLNNPEFIGNVYSVVDINPIAPAESKTGETYKTSWASETLPTTGTYYPYILLGEQNPQTQAFEVKDVKAFDNAITITNEVSAVETVPTTESVPVAE